MTGPGQQHAWGMLALWVNPDLTVVPLGAAWTLPYAGTTMRTALAVGVREGKSGAPAHPYDAEGFGTANTAV